MLTTTKLIALDVVLNSANSFRCTANWSLQPGWDKALHDFDLWYVWGGLGRMTTSGGVIDLYPGRGIWMRPGRRYEATHDPKALLRVFAVHFLLKNKTGLLQPVEFIPPVEVFDAATPAYFEPAMSHVVELQSQRTANDAAALLFKSLLLEIAARGQSMTMESELRRHYKLTLNPVIALIHDNPERRFTLGELAARTGYTADHFARLFRAATGQSPKEFMIHHRMERARALLKDSSHTVTEIADLLGYPDLGFFSRQFKEQVGASPDSFRRRGVTHEAARDYSI